MKHKVFLLIGTLVCAFSGCSNEQSSAADEGPATDAELVLQVQQCSRLYSTEYRVHKIVACESSHVVEGFGLSFDLSLLGDRKIVIPMEATVKGYIDFSLFSEKNVERRGDHLIITLPDPEVMLTSTRIQQEDVREYVSGLRDAFSDSEMTAFEAQGRDAIIEEIPHLGIEQTARENAVRMLMPLLTQMGFDEHHITINFRHDYSPYDLTRKFN